MACRARRTAELIIPSRTVDPDRALLTVGADILATLNDGPLSISQAWIRTLAIRASRGSRAPVSFEWFTLALDVLYTIKAVAFDGSVLRIVSNI